MLRKLTVLMSIALLLSLSIVASAQDDTEWTCGNVDSGLDASFTCTGWEGPGEVEKWLMTFDEFFAEYYPRIAQVNNTGVSWGDYWTMLPVQISGGAEIDMMRNHNSRNATFAENDWLLPLDDYLEACPPPGWPEAFANIDAFNYQGQQYALPYDFAQGGFYINVDLFEAAGLDIPTEETTWDEIVEMAQALTELAPFRWTLNLSKLPVAQTAPG